jgi:fused signal recognition particle receptor
MVNKDYNSALLFLLDTLDTIAMTFNWFNRLNQSTADQSQTDTAPSPTTEQPESATDTPASDATADELLDYAKRAYANLQKRQATSSSGDAVSEAEVAPPASEITVEATPELTTPPSAEPETTEHAATELKVEATETATAAAVPEPSDTPTKIYAPPPDDSALPFWARAEADREVRLARLRETAIETPTPASPTPASPTTAAAPISEFETPATASAVPETAVPETAAPEATTAPVILDGDFMWSAEVLAMEGRQPEDISIEEITWLKQLRQGLDRTRRSLINNLRAVVGQGPLNEDGVMEIEALLLQADVGIEATDRIIAALQTKLRENVLPPEQAIEYLKQILRDLLEEPLQGRHRVAFAPEKDQLNIWLITGVNGAGKTTTIGKLANIATKSGYKCLIAAADTFRAAAVEQVKVWGQRSDVEVIANPGRNTDPAAVVFDAISAAQSRGTELLLVDTAGRLQNKKNLMDELTKIRRIIDKKTDEAKIESLLVLDATLGQNGLQQAKVFAEAAQLSGIVLTKLDGTAKGGIALAVVQQLGLPIRFIGAGEGIEDLRPFSSYEFVEALISG